MGPGDLHLETPTLASFSAAQITILWFLDRTTCGNIAARFPRGVSTLTILLLRVHALILAQPPEDEIERRLDRGAADGGAADVAEFVFFVKYALA